MGSPPPAHGDTYLRIRKDGVIYYFFSNREASPGQTSTALRKRGLRRQLPPSELKPVIHEASRHYNVPPALIKAVIKVESNFNPGALSPKGAQGLMQLMPGTAADLQVANPYDVRENVLAGTRYLALLLQRFQHRLPQALAAYNAGPRRVDRHQAVPPIAETQEFVRSVCQQFLSYESEKSREP